MMSQPYVLKKSCARDKSTSSNPKNLVCGFTHSPRGRFLKSWAETIEGILTHVLVLTMLIFIYILGAKTGPTFFLFIRSWIEFFHQQIK